MQRQRSFRSFLSALVCVVAGAALVAAASTEAHAQGRLDGPAQSKIDEAINVHYLATDFRKAEELLSGTINACGNQCSAPVIAKAWMYIGIIRGAGNSDLRGAKEAFRSAFSVHPSVALDNDLATPEVQAAFAEARGQSPAGPAAPVVLTPAAPPAAAPPPPPPPPPPPVTYDPMQCEPKVQEVQTRRPVPVSCTSQYPGVVKGALYYKAFGEPSFGRVAMKRVGNAWQAEVPCTATNMGTNVSWYVEVSDARGARLDGYGTPDGPVDIMLNDATAEPPPHFAGQPAPNRCADLADCPPEMLGTPACPGTEKPGAANASAEGGKGWGDACEEHAECQSGLACMNGSCETAPSCSADADCDDGHCDMTTGTCAYGETESEADSGAIGKGPKNMVSLTLGMDFTLVNGSAVCDPVKNPNFACYYADEPYYLATTADGTSPTQYNALDGSVRDRYWDGGTAAGIGFGTIRILLAYDMMLLDQVSGGVNAGLAISPIPGAGIALHADVHGKYWFSGNSKGLRPFVGLGLGFGPVDSMTTVQVVETAYEDSGFRQPNAAATSMARTGTTGLANGTAFTTDLCLTPDKLPQGAATLQNEFCQLPVQAATTFGSAFLALGVGAWFNLGGHGPQLELYGKVLLPDSGVSLQPALSYVYGF